MPFSEMSGGISTSFKLPSESGRFGGEPLGHAALFVATAVVEIGSDAIAVRILPGSQSNARRRTDGRVDVEIGELDSFGSEAIDVLGFHLSAEAGEVGVTHVIDKNDDDIWPFLSKENEGAEEECEESFHHGAEGMS